MKEIFKKPAIIGGAALAVFLVAILLSYGGSEEVVPPLTVEGLAPLRQTEAPAAIPLSPESPAYQVPKVQTSQGQSPMPFIDNANDIDVETLSLRIETKDRSLFILDVREPQEYDDVHINNAVLIPLGELGERLNEIPRDKTIVVYCRSGRRSKQAVGILRRKGFNNVLNLEGGMTEWSRVHPCDPNKKAC